MSERACLINLDHLLLPCAGAEGETERNELPSFFRRLGDLPVTLVTSASRASIACRLADAGIDVSRFSAIVPEFDRRAHAAAALAPRSDGTPAGRGLTPAGTLFVVSAEPRDLQWGTAPPPAGLRVVPLLLARSDADAPPELIDEAWLVGRELAEAAMLINAPRRSETLSVVLMAYNEAPTIGVAIREIRQFLQLYVGGGEIIVVDDGSTDETFAQATALAGPDLQVLRHATNLGMGASMRTGYLVARHEYVTSLPADRQIRAQSLVPLLARLNPTTCTHGFYTTPHSGARRQVLSVAFTLLRRHVGGLTVDFAGAYIFHRRWCEAIDLRRLPAESFVFSFELLQALKEQGCGFRAVPLRAFLRTAGTSRVARPGRMLKVAAELVRSRVSQLAQRSRAT